MIRMIVSQAKALHEWYLGRIKSKCFVIDGASACQEASVKTKEEHEDHRDLHSCKPAESYAGEESDRGS